MDDTVEHAEQMRDHWWWRPGWRAGRHFYACHFTFEDQPLVHRLVSTYQSELVGFNGLDLIPAPWLHLTMQGIGFVDEVSDEQVRRVIDAVAAGLGRVERPVVTFGSAVVRPEAVYLPVEPAGAIVAIREIVRAAVSGIVGALEPAQPYTPHVSVAYANRPQPASPIAAALPILDPVTVTLDRVQLLHFHRDRRMYEWTHAVALPIGANA
ncbi:2'-5' RNA ligase family protein [Actinoplanes sp. L3-i22]|uniref:2'-5' RNA ligase family protein n=1 Tax=Actinoplanes sp. L3-i22 TaxID=2836373 RepID=UPI001C774523|nr:2'-5' RNA ligase family protein [Actinoplanes sp. L3-i22]BCY08862.1 hypothetical protein L3i22_039500 [Actinoplanes sp. L3-i22]